MKKEEMVGKKLLGLAQRAAGAEGHIFQGVAEADAQAGAVAEGLLNLPAAVADQQKDFADAAALEQFELVLEERLALDAHQGLGLAVGERAQARAQPARQNDRRNHRTFSQAATPGDESPRPRPTSAARCRAQK